MAVMIGVDPHKRSHTAVAVDPNEVELGRLEVRAARGQVEELRRWAAQFGDCVWAIESADGLGFLLGQQLVGAGERVVDVPATLSARVRVLASGRSNKNDPNDGYSVAIAAMHAPGLRVVERADHAAVLRLLAKRNKQLSGARRRRRAGSMRCWQSWFRAEFVGKSRRNVPRNCWRPSHRRMP